MANTPLTNKDGEVRELTSQDFAKFRPIDEFPELSGLVKTRGRQKQATKQATTIRLSPEVMAFFKAGGKGWQTRIDDALKAYVKTHS